MQLKSTNKTEVNMTELTATIDADRFEKAVEATYRRQKKNISLPGFRKGKVPRGLVEKTYGESVFYEDAINSVLNEELPDLIDKAGLELVDTPRVDATNVSREEGAELKITCVTKPEIHIADYFGLEAERPSSEVTDDAVETQLDQMRHRNARMISVDDRAAQKGDEVTIDFEGFFGDEAFEGGKAEDYELRLGSGSFIPGFEDQIVGHNIDEPFDVVVTFPEDYQMADYAGKEATFHCLIHSISIEELPELDDDFARDTSDFDTLEELRADTRKKLEDNAEQSSKNTFQNAIMEQIIAKVEDPIPHCMYEKRADSLLRNYANQLEQQGVSLEMYLQYTGMTQDELKATYLERAESEVKLRLALEQIAKQENIEVSDEELDEEIHKIADRDNVDFDYAKSVLPLEDLKVDILATKALDLVMDKAVAKESVPAEESAEDAPEDTASSEEE